MKNRRRAILVGLAIVYLSGPFIAGLCNYPDKRGPLIYPEFYHVTVFTIAWCQMPESPQHDGHKPRVPFLRTRPFFYGMERGWVPRPTDPNLAESYDRERARAR